MFAIVLAYRGPSSDSYGAPIIYSLSQLHGRKQLYSNLFPVACFVELPLKLIFIATFYSFAAIPYSNRNIYPLSGHLRSAQITYASKNVHHIHHINFSKRLKSMSTPHIDVASYLKISTRVHRK
jgi:hypothetical protein